MKPYLSFAITCQHQLYVITTYSEAHFSHSSLKKSTFFPLLSRLIVTVPIPDGNVLFPGVKCSSFRSFTRTVKVSYG